MMAVEKPFLSIVIHNAHFFEKGMHLLLQETDTCI